MLNQISLVLRLQNYMSHPGPPCHIKLMTIELCTHIIQQLLVIIHAFRVFGKGAQIYARYVYSFREEIKK